MEYNTTTAHVAVTARRWLPAVCSTQTLGPAGWYAYITKGQNTSRSFSLPFRQTIGGVTHALVIHDRLFHGAQAAAVSTEGLRTQATFYCVEIYDDFLESVKSHSTEFAVCLGCSTYKLTW